MIQPIDFNYCLPHINQDHESISDSTPLLAGPYRVRVDLNSDPGGGRRAVGGFFRAIRGAGTGRRRLALVATPTPQ